MGCINWQCGTCGGKNDFHQKQPLEWCLAHIRLLTGQHQGRVGYGGRPHLAMVVYGCAVEQP